MNLSFNVHSSNLGSLISIYLDSEEIRKKRMKKFERKFIENDSEYDFDKYSHYRIHFDWLLLQALFISGFSYFESFMRSAAKVCEKEIKSDIKISDLKGNGDIDTYRKYLNLICNLKNAENQSENWIKLMEFKGVRNSIIHEYGRIKKDYKIISTHDIYYGPSKKMLRIKNIKFLEDFVDTSIEYMSKINEEYKNKGGLNFQI